ncbi:MAG TPA: SgcJ/EcaC family oxidoreductase [Sphingomicrobium sp.]|nr:SgcJ/EcaC family oxidoreductase [Sphingomicrobium sp.]
MNNDELPTTPIQTFAAAWNVADAEKLASVFAEDADFTAVNGLRVSGRDLIGTGHAELFRTIFRGTTLAVEVLAVRMLAPGVAAVEAQFTYPNGILPGVTRSIAHYVARENSTGSWEIIIFRNMIPFERPVAGPVEEEIRRKAASIG